MVLICNKIFNEEEKYNSLYFSNYFNKIELSDFQKWAIKAIVDEDHVLITAHTGSGKTLPAEFAIQYLVSKGKKVIYTTPIKALSNQKLYDFRRKFPHISFGILTGDCKDNPEADVLIMTTEILRNTLFNKKINSTAKDGSITSVPVPLMFEMDFETDLGAVVFDEVHYINDPERGSVWEQSILLLPSQVQMLMLSATIDKPENFAGWIETEKNNQARLENRPSKKMYLTPTYERVVPLSHYMWLSIHNSTFHAAKKTPYEQKLNALYKTPILLSTSKGEFHDSNYHKVNDILDFLNKKNTFTKRQFVLDDLVKYLNANDMLPAICFVFSRKNVELAAKEIGMCLFEKDSGIPAIIEKECRHIIMTKLANYKEYINLPEYLELVALLEKGIAIHHAGMMPVLREMVELLFEKGFIKLLVATETFAVGINMPTKTVIFSGLTKFNGSTMRLLYPSEYTQMAGRAGRRGIDTIGHVIHCNNLFEMPSITEYKTMLTGKPQTLISKFKISFTLILNILSQNKDTLLIRDFIEKSLLAYDIKREIEYFNEKAKELDLQLTIKKEQLQFCQTPERILKEYKEKLGLMQTATNSKKKTLKRELTDIETLYKFLESDLKKIDAIAACEKEVNENHLYKKNTEDYIKGSIDQVIMHILQPAGFVDMTEDVIINEKGCIAAHVQEMHPLVMADLYTKTDGFSEFSARDLVAIFSCFTSINVPEDMKQLNPEAHSYPINRITLEITRLLEYYEKLETTYNVDSGSSYEINYDIQTEMLDWCLCENEEDCKKIIHRVKSQKNISLGDFVKAILKINTIAKEMEKIAEMKNNIILLEKINKIPVLTLKYVVSNQSLYI